MDNLFLLSDKQKKIKQAVIELDKLNNSFKQQEEAYRHRKDELQAVIKDYTDQNNLSEFGFKTKNGFVKAKTVLTVKTTWFLDKLSEKLSKNVFSEIVDKTYTITDFDGLVSYLKSCGVDPKEFKKFIDVERKVNEKKIDQLGKLGEITQEDITGCYEAQAAFKCIKISELEE